MGTNLKVKYYETQKTPKEKVEHGGENMFLLVNIPILI